MTAVPVAMVAMVVPGVSVAVAPQRVLTVTAALAGPRARPATAVPAVPVMWVKRLVRVVAPVVPVGMPVPAVTVVPAAKPAPSAAWLARTGLVPTGVSVVSVVLAVRASRVLMVWLGPVR